LFLAKNRLVGEAVGAINNAIAKQEERESVNRLVDYRTGVEKEVRELTTVRSSRSEDVADVGLEGFNEGDEVRHSLHGPTIADKRIDIMKEKFLESIPASQRDSMSKAAEDIKHQAMGRVFVQSQKWAEEDEFADFHVNLNKLVDNHLYDAAINWVNLSDVVSEDKKEEFRHSISIEKETNIYMQDLLEGDVRGMQTNIDQLTSDQYDGLLNDQQRLALVQTTKGKMSEIESDNLKATELDRGRVISDLEMSVRYGGGTPVDIYNVYNKDIGMTAAKMTELLVIYQERANDGAKAANQTAMVQNYLDGGRKMSPINGDHKTAVNKYFEGLVAANPDPKNYASLVAQAAATGIIPEMVINQLVGANQSDNPSHMEQAAAIFSMLEQQEPTSLYSMVPEKHRKTLEVYSSLRDAGNSVGDAFAVAKAGAALNEDERDLLVKEFDSIGTSDIDKSLRDHMDEDINFNPVKIYEFGLGAPPPDPSPAMIAEHRKLAKEYFVFSKGDEKVASDRAWQNIKGYWSRTKVNGINQVMRLSPEKLYKLPSETIRQQFEEDVDFWAKREKIPGVDPKKLLLLYEEGYTEQSGSYIIATKDEHGITFPLGFGPSGRPYAWGFDFDAYGIKVGIANNDAAVKGKRTREMVLPFDMDAIKRGNKFGHLTPESIKKGGDNAE
jgi:hypothetical protein